MAKERPLAVFHSFLWNLQPLSDRAFFHIAYMEIKLGVRIINIPAQPFDDNLSSVVIKYAIFLAPIYL